MAHVHGAKAIASQIKSGASAGAAKMTGYTMGEMGPMMMGGTGTMMNDGMSSMMKMGEGMAQVMKHSKTPGVGIAVAAGAVTSAGSSVGKSVISKIFTHPLVIFSLGVVVGCCIYKYRKSIISASDEAQQEE